MLQLHDTCLYLVMHSPDGAITDSNNSRLIAAYYSFIDPERMKDWVHNLDLLTQLAYTLMLPMILSFFRTRVF